MFHHGDREEDDDEDDEDDNDADDDEEAQDYNRLPPLTFVPLVCLSSPKS